MLRAIDMIGAVGADAPKAILIRLNPLDIARGPQGGALGKLAANYLPQIAAGKVYDEIMGKMRTGFASEGVNAEVILVDDPRGGAATIPSDFATGVVVGAGAVGLGAVAWYYLGLKALLGKWFGRAAPPVTAARPPLRLAA